MHTNIDWQGRSPHAVTAAHTTDDSSGPHGSGDATQNESLATTTSIVRLTRIRKYLVFKTPHLDQLFPTPDGVLADGSTVGAGVALSHRLPSLPLEEELELRVDTPRVKGAGLG